MGRRRVEGPRVERTRRRRANGASAIENANGRSVRGVSTTTIVRRGVGGHRRRCRGRRARRDHEPKSKPPPHETRLPDPSAQLSSSSVTAAPSSGVAWVLGEVCAVRCFHLLSHDRFRPRGSRDESASVRRPQERVNDRRMLRAATCSATAWRRRCVGGARNGRRTEGTSTLPRRYRPCPERALCVL